MSLNTRVDAAIDAGPQDYKTYFMLISAAREILNAYKYKHIKKLCLFQAQISLKCYFSYS